MPQFGVPDWVIMGEYRHVDDPEDAAVWAGCATRSAVIEVDFDGGREPVTQPGYIEGNTVKTPAAPASPPLKVKTTVRRGEWILGRAESSGVVRLWVVPGLWFGLKYREVI